MSAEMTARALRLIQRGIDGPLAERCHCGIVARVSKVRQAQRERPPAGAHCQCFRLIAPACLDPPSHRLWQHPKDSEVGRWIAACEIAKSITPDRWPSLTSRLPG